MKDLKMADCW